MIMRTSILITLSGLYALILAHPQPVDEPSSLPPDSQPWFRWTNAKDCPLQVTDEDKNDENRIVISKSNPWVSYFMVHGEDYPKDAYVRVYWGIKHSKTDTLKIGENCGWPAATGHEKKTGEEIAKLQKPEGDYNVTCFRNVTIGQKGPGKKVQMFDYDQTLRQERTERLK